MSHAVWQALCAEVAQRTEQVVACQAALTRAKAQQRDGDLRGALQTLRPFDARLVAPALALALLTARQRMLMRLLSQNEGDEAARQQDAADLAQVKRDLAALHGQDNAVAALFAPDAIPTAPGQATMDGAPRQGWLDEALARSRALPGASGRSDRRGGRAVIWNANHAICLFLSLVSAGDAWSRSSWRGAGVPTVDPQRVLDALFQMVRQNLVIGAFLLSGIFLALVAGRVLMERWRRTLLRRGEARGRQAALDEVRMLAHAQLKAHVMATQRCLLQAQEAGEPGEMRRWIDAGTAQVARLLQVAVGLHHAVSDSALPDDLEQTARDTVASLAVAYPHCTCTLDVCGPRPTAIDDTVQRAVVLMLYNALHNAYTHGKPSSVHVHLRYAPDALILIVRDDGNGGASTAHTGAGRGLRDMERLAARCGGALRIESVPMSGTVVTATMPLTIKGAPDDSLWLALAAPARRRAGRSAALAERGDRAALPCD